MARARVEYQCNECGYRSPKWLGKCPDCSNWNSFVEARPAVEIASGKAAARTAGARIGGADDAIPRPVTQLGSDEPTTRLVSGIGEFDRILGGGLVPGSVTLIAGSPPCPPA